MEYGKTVWPVAYGDEQGLWLLFTVVRSEHCLYPDAPQRSPAGEQRGQVLSSIPEETVDFETCKSYPT